MTSEEHRTVWHCKIKNLIKLNSELLDGGEGTRAKIDAIEKMGFDGLLYVKIKAIRSEPVKWLCENLDCSKRTLPLPHGKKFQLTDSDVHRVYKLPLGVHIKIESLKANDRLKAKIKSLEKELGLKGGKRFLVPKDKVYKKLEDRNTSDPIKFAKLYVLYALATLLAPTGGGKVDLRYAQYLDDIDRMKHYNWAGYVLENTIDKVATFQKKDLQKHPSSRPGGDMHFLAVNFYDYLDGHGNLETPPSCSKWTSMVESEAFKELMEEVKQRNSMSEDDSDLDIVPTDGVDVKIVKAEAFERECRYQLNYWKEKMEKTERKIEQLRAQKARASKGGERLTRRNLGRDFSEADRRSTRAHAKVKEVPNMKRKCAVRNSKEVGTGKRSRAAIPDRMSPASPPPASPVKQYVRRKRSRLEGEDDGPSSKKTFQEDNEASYPFRCTLSSPPPPLSAPVSHSPPWLGSDMYEVEASIPRCDTILSVSQHDIVGSCMDIVPYLSSGLPANMVLRALLFVAWYHIQLGEEDLQQSHQDEEAMQESTSGAIKQTHEDDETLQKADETWEEAVEALQQFETDEEALEENESVMEQTQEGDDILEKAYETLEEATEKGEDSMHDDTYIDVVQIARENCQEDVHDYTYVELPMKEIKIRRPLVPTKIVKSPISVDWQYLGDPITTLDKSVTKLVWGNALEDGVVVFDDGKLEFSKNVSMSCAGRNHLDDRIVDAYCDYLHRKQRSTYGRIKKLCFPTHFARQAHKEVKRKFIPDPNEKKLLVSNLIEAVESDGEMVFQGDDCDYYFFPCCRKKHYVLFAIDVKAMKFVYMNSVEAAESFNYKDKFSMQRIIQYFLTYMQTRRPEVKWTEFTWEVAGVIEQKDEFSCGIFLIWFIEHWKDGYLPELLQPKYLNPENIHRKRAQVLARILLQPENKYLEFLKTKAEGSKKDRKKK